MFGCLFDSKSPDSGFPFGGLDLDLNPWFLSANAKPFGFTAQPPGSKLRIRGKLTRLFPVPHSSSKASKNGLMGGSLIREQFPEWPMVLERLRRRPGGSHLFLGAGEGAVFIAGFGGVVGRGDMGWFGAHKGGVNPFWIAQRNLKDATQVRGAPMNDSFILLLHSMLFLVASFSQQETSDIQPIFSRMFKMTSHSRLEPTVRTADGREPGKQSGFSHPVGTS